MDIEKNSQDTAFVRPFCPMDAPQVHSVYYTGLVNGGKIMTSLSLLRADNPLLSRFSGTLCHHSSFPTLGPDVSCLCFVDFWRWHDSILLSARHSTSWLGHHSPLLQFHAVSVLPNSNSLFRLLSWRSPVWYVRHCELLPAGSWKAGPSNKVFLGCRGPICNVGKWLWSCGMRSSW